MNKFAIAAACVASTQALTIKETATAKSYAAEASTDEFKCSGLCLAAATAAAEHVGGLGELAGKKAFDAAVSKFRKMCFWC